MGARNANSEGQSYTASAFTCRVIVKINSTQEETMSSYSSVRIKEELTSQTLLTPPQVLTSPDFHHMFQNYPHTLGEQSLKISQI